MRVTTSLIAATLLPGPLACATDRAIVERPPAARPLVERVDADTVRFRWPKSFAEGPVAIYAGSSPETIDRRQPLIVADQPPVLLKNSRGAPPVDATRRLYYELIPETGGAPVLAAERRLPLEGPDNFRDLGGYETADGHRVRWGRLYRSSRLSTLTPDDLDYLQSLELNLVCDFRSEREREARPSPPLSGDPPQQVSLPVVEEAMDPDLLRDKIRTGGITELALERSMREAYRAFVTDHSAEWSTMFRRLAEPSNHPTLVHCSAGKDRTGFAAALVLLALGVPQETVFEDYLLTNRYQQELRRFVLRWVPLYSFFRTDPKDLLPLLEARRAYLQTSLDTMVEQYGSPDAYLEEALGVSADMRTALRAHLLD